jgi:hypothetical protein
MSRASFLTQHGRINADAIIPHADANLPCIMLDFHFDATRTRVVERCAMLPVMRYISSRNIGCRFLPCHRLYRKSVEAPFAEVWCTLSSSPCFDGLNRR